MTIKRILVVALAILLPASMLSAAEDELAERMEIKFEAGDAYLRGDFKKLEMLFNRYADFRNQRTSSGASKMQLFYDGIGEAMNNVGESVLEDDIKRTKKWVDLNKQSPLGKVCISDRYAA